MGKQRKAEKGKEEDLHHDHGGREKERVKKEER
jgi:hypothetical protein